MNSTEFSPKPPSNSVLEILPVEPVKITKLKAPKVKVTGAVGDSNEGQLEDQKRPATWKPMDDGTTFPFGPHQGEPIGNVPAVYLDKIRGEKWLIEKWPQVADYIERFWKYISYELKHGRDD